jgi:Cysteine-rich CPCC
MFENIYKLIEDEKTYRCPCCKFKTLLGRGHYEICPVCFWEDDGQDEHDSDEVRGGPNRSLSLRVAQDNFRRFRAVEERFLVHVRGPESDEL